MNETMQVVSARDNNDTRKFLRRDDPQEMVHCPGTIKNDGEGISRACSIQKKKLRYRKTRCCTVVVNSVQRTPNLYTVSNVICKLRTTEYQAQMDCLLNYSKLRVKNWRKTFKSQMHKFGKMRKCQAYEQGLEVSIHKNS